ncbi:hypothetical protein L1887_20283 [Cichorium endivia]|nr:hypothetical protein L1887_20283 [Cichorium endivia]
MKVTDPDRSVLSARRCHRIPAPSLPSIIGFHILKARRLIAPQLSAGLNHLHRRSFPLTMRGFLYGDHTVYIILANWISSIVKLSKDLANMQNEEGQNMDLYIPRKCSATNRLITSKDHASVQINVGHLDESGRYTGQFSTFALCGFVRAQGDADSALDRLWQKKKVETRQ